MALLDEHKLFTDNPTLGEGGKRESLPQGWIQEISEAWAELGWVGQAQNPCAGTTEGQCSASLNQMIPTAQEATLGIFPTSGTQPGIPP